MDNFYVIILITIASLASFMADIRMIEVSRFAILLGAGFFLSQKNTLGSFKLPSSDISGDISMPARISALQRIK